MRLCGAVSDRLLPLLFAMHPSTRRPPKRRLPPEEYPSSMSVEYISVTRQGGRINKKRVIETKADMRPFDTDPEDDNSCPPANADTPQVPQAVPKSSAQQKVKSKASAKPNANPPSRAVSVSRLFLPRHHQLTRDRRNSPNGCRIVKGFSMRSSA